MSSIPLEKRRERQAISKPKLVGIEIKSLPDGSTLALTPSGRLYHIEAEAAEVYRVLKACNGKTPAASILTHSHAADGFSQILEALLQDGCLQESALENAGPSWCPFQHTLPRLLENRAITLALVGDPDLVALVRDLFDATSTERSTFLPSLSEHLLIEAADLPSLTRELGKRSSHTVMVIALRHIFDQAFLLELNDYCETHHLCWTQFHIDRNRGWLGPTIVPTSTPDYRDLLGRRQAAVENFELFQVLTSPSLYREPFLPSREALLWMLSFLLADVEQWLVESQAQTLSHEVEMNPAEQSIIRHPLLPLPDHHLCQQEMSLQRRQGRHLLLDRRIGIITHLQKIDHDPSIPGSLITVQSYVSNMHRLYPWANNTICQGSAFSDYAAAYAAAIGEGIERYCGNWVQTAGIRKCSCNELLARGEYALDSRRVVLYSESQYRTPGFPFVPFTPDLEIHWVKGWSLTGGRAIWIPASLVYINWYTDRFSDEPPITNLFYAGIAAGSTLESALVSAIEEVIERDATMAWWSNRQPLPAIELPPELRRLWEGEPERRGQRGWLIYLENEFDVPVMAGVVENVQEKLFNIGFAARSDPTMAALKAWTEALTLQDGSRDLLDPEGLFWKGIAHRQLDSQSVKPWQADRNYLDLYRTDFKDVNTLMCQQQIFLDPRARERVRPWVDTEARREFAELPRLEDRSLQIYRRLLEQRGYEILYVDVTTPDVALSGMRVVRVIIPGLVSNFPAAFPFLGQGRLQRIPLQLGWRKRPLEEDELNYFPLPHA